jgi:hypothetical protein
MKLSTIVVVTAALAVLAAVLVLSQKQAPAPMPAGREGTKLVDAVNVARADRVRIRGEGDSVVELRRGEDGVWLVPSYHDLPADFDRLARTVRALTDAQVRRFVTENPGRIARMGFSGLGLRLADGEAVILDMEIGKSVEGGGRFVRFAGDGRAYESDFDAWIDVNPRSWVKTELTNFTPGDVSELELEFVGGESITFSRESSADEFVSCMQVVDRRVRDGYVNTLLGQIGQIRFMDTEEPGADAAKSAFAGAVTYRARLFSGEEWTILIGRGPAGEAGGAGDVFARVTSSKTESPINRMMERRSFKIGNWIFSQLPARLDDVFEPIQDGSATQPVEVPSP